jgi:Lrp/AsnC family transcriptional regulator, regulator for asnA, asnC and gidA
LTIAAIVDPASISYRSDAMLGINVAPGHTPASVAERVGECPNVVYSVWIGGRYDLLIEVVFEGDEELPIFMDTYCYSDPGIASVEIMMGIKMFKNQFLLKRDFSQPRAPSTRLGK